MTSLLSPGLHVQATTIEALEASPNIWGLLLEYAQESAAPDMVPPAIRARDYKRLEALGVLHPISALLDGELIGYVTVLASEIPHYGRAIAVTESIFVAKAHRKTGAGLKLLRAAEAKARELGSPVLLVAAPATGDLAAVLPRVGYGEVGRTFLKKVMP